MKWYNSRKVLAQRLSLYERRRQLIVRIYERQQDTIGNLAFEFGVSSHTIRNDIRVLELEYPIYTRMGAGGGVFILDSSRLQQRWLTVRQRELLMDVCSVLDDEQALLMRSIIGGLSPWIVNAVQTISTCYWQTANCRRILNLRIYSVPAPLQLNTQHNRYFTFPVGRTARFWQTLTHGGERI